MAHDECVLITGADLQRLIDVLRRLGYSVIGPSVRDGAVICTVIEDTGQLPAGWTDKQGSGTYQLTEREDGAYFGYALGPHTWKNYLHPPVACLWRTHREEGDLIFVAETTPSPRYAFLGVRPCELAAISIQDQVFLREPCFDPVYQTRREGALLIAVNCTRPGGTCFCASMKTGPRADAGYDLALTELVGKDRHDFLVEVGTERGREVLRELPGRPVGADDRALAEARLAEAAGHMGRTLDTGNLRELLSRNLESTHWDEVGGRCLACANCTMVCPTCFCTTVEDVTAVGGDCAERRRVWDSCFTLDFSYIHGGAVRATTKSRYRQWLTHKLGTWHDQFGSSGCVGCGRCITWCPAAIDLTVEIAALRTRETEERHTVSVKESVYGNT